MNEHLRVHILYEHNTDKNPFSPSYIRLIRPLTHPTLASIFDTSYGIDLPDERVDIVILDRLWRPDLSMVMVKNLVNQIRQMGAKFLHHIDDNLFDVIVPRNRAYPPKDFVSLLSYILDQADGVLTSTQALCERLLAHNSNIQVVPNALDERLFSVDARIDDLSTNNPDKITIGYMGTPTHDADLKVILPALNQVARRHRGKIQIEIIGVIGNRKTLWRLKRLPLQNISPKIEDIAYIRFLPWFTANIRWDIALAPLVDTNFTRNKSDIKFLDYAAIGAAGIFSHGPVYSPTIDHLKTGWLAENRKKFWVEALDSLILDEPLRREIALNASRYLYDKRILAQCSKDWVDAIFLLCGFNLSERS